VGLWPASSRAGSPASRTDRTEVRQEEDSVEANSEDEEAREITEFLHIRKMEDINGISL
jgi:hypothetical protein